MLTINSYYIIYLYIEIYVSNTKKLYFLVDIHLKFTFLNFGSISTTYFGAFLLSLYNLARFVFISCDL